MGEAFEPAERDRVLELLVREAEGDGDVVSAALVGSLAGAGADRFSDIDLALGIADGAERGEVVELWSRRLVSDLGASVLVDHDSGHALYRIFLLPGMLQVDISFARGEHVPRAGEPFELLFGEASENQDRSRRTPESILGWGILYTRFAHVCIRRGKAWQALRFVAAVREAAMDLACIEDGLPDRDGRGYDRLPPEILERFEDTIFSGSSPGELTRALAAAASLLLEPREVVSPSPEVESQIWALVEGEPRAATDEFRRPP